MCAIDPQSCGSASLRVIPKLSPRVDNLALNEIVFGNILMLMPLFLHRKLERG